MPRRLRFQKYLLAAVVVAGFSILGVYARQSVPGQSADAGWISLFDGSSLDGWDGRSDVWRVEDGAITGEVAAGPSSVTDTTYIFWKGGEPSDFEFKADIKTLGPYVNTGIVYRGYVLPAAAPGAGGGRVPNNTPYKLGGPQLDFDGSNRYSGQYFEIASDRGLLARRGQIVETSKDHQPEVIGSVGDDNTLGGYIKPADWNQVRIIARGNTIIHLINGHATSVLVDNDLAKFRPKGLLAFQLEGAGKVQFRNVWLNAN